MTACDSGDDVRITMETPPDTMTLTPSSDSVTLKVEDADKQALTLSWNSATDRGPSTSLTYLYRIGLDEKLSDIKPVPVSGNSISYTGEELNDLLQEWGIQPGISVDVTAEIIASVNDESKFHKPEISKSTFTVTGYQDVSRPLWIVNPAMNDGIGYNSTVISQTDKLTEVILSKKYRWQGWFDAETGVKLVYDKTTGFPSLNKGLDNNTLVKRTDASQPDDLLMPPADGFYTLTIDAKSLTAEWEIYVPFEHVYFTGLGMPCNWNIESPIELTRDSDHPEIFIYEGPLNVGDIKGYFQLGSWDNDAIMPPVDQVSPENAHEVVIMPGGQPDYKWHISVPGNYRFEFNSNLFTIKFTKLD